MTTTATIEITANNDARCPFLATATRPSRSDRELIIFGGIYTRRAAGRTADEARANVVDLMAMDDLALGAVARSRAA